jgi:hypothetical protein
MSEGHRPQRQDRRRGRLRATLVSVGCLLRGLPLFFSATPKTPLRVLGIIALDTLHVIRHSRRLPRKRISDLARWLDFEGYANAAWDGKAQCEAESQATRRWLETTGLESCLHAYLRRLRQLEGRRPSAGGDHRRFDEVRSYREAVVRLSISTAAVIALNTACLDDDIGTIDSDGDVDTLFRILMQCQIIDDVMDYAEDLSAGLPSFLTACGSLQEAVVLTAQAARSYAACEGSSANSVLPLRLALSVISALTNLVVSVAGWRYREARQFAS